MDPLIVLGVLAVQALANVLAIVSSAQLHRLVESLVNAFAE